MQKEHNIKKFINFQVLKSYVCKTIFFLSELPDPPELGIEAESRSSTTQKLDQTVSSLGKERSEFCDRIQQWAWKRKRKTFSSIKLTFSSSVDGAIFFFFFSPSSVGVERQDTVRIFLCLIVVGSKVKRVNYSHKKSLAPVKRESKSKKSSCSMLGERDLCGVKITFHCAALFSFRCLYDTHRCHGVKKKTWHKFPQ